MNMGVDRPGLTHCQGAVFGGRDTSKEFGFADLVLGRRTRRSVWSTPFVRRDATRRCSDVRSDVRNAADLIVSFVELCAASSTLCLL